LNFTFPERSCIPLQGEGGVILPCYFDSQGTSLFRGYSRGAASHRLPRNFTVSWLGTAGHGAGARGEGDGGRGNSSLLFRQPRDSTVSWLWLVMARKGGAASHISIAVINERAQLVARSRH
jgi:hypothetical protein